MNAMEGREREREMNAGGRWLPEEGYRQREMVFEGY